MSTERVSASHIGYLCRAPKFAVIHNPTSKTFTIQNMAMISEAPLGKLDVFKVVYTGAIEYRETLMGTFGVCDFSSITTPGVYRVVLPDSGARTYQFNMPMVPITGCPICSSTLSTNYALAISKMICAVRCIWMMVCVPIMVKYGTQSAVGTMRATSARGQPIPLWPRWPLCMPSSTFASTAAYSSSLTPSQPID